MARSFHVLPGGDRIIVDVPSGVRTRADPSRLDQMVGNLLHNAVRYSVGGPVVLRAGTASDTEVWIEVCGQGSGIGLPVVRPLAELHGGRIELTTTQDSGSTFRIILPRATEGLKSLALLPAAAGED